jgi:integrase
LITVTFTGLRSSELRGLRWDDVDLKRGELHVRQRDYGAAEGFLAVRLLGLNAGAINGPKQT